MNQSSLWMLKRADLPGGLFHSKHWTREQAANATMSLAPPQKMHINCRAPNILCTLPAFDESRTKHV